MCGKYAAGELTQEEMLAIFNSFLYGTPLPETHPNYFRPTDEIAIIRKDARNWEVNTARWWLIPRWFKGELRDWKATTFNARLETAHEKPVYKEAWRNGRCLIPALSYSEFTGKRSPKTEWHIRPKINQDWFFIAGLLSQWGDLTTCTMLTREARAEIRDIHHRQPVILNQDEIERWFDGEDVEGNSYELEFKKAS